MQINQLVDILNFIKNIITDKKLIYHYNELSNIILANPNSNIDLQNKREVIIHLQHEINPNKWRDYQSKLLLKYDKNDLFGEEAIKVLNTILDKTPFEPKKAAKEINTIVKSLNDFIEIIESLLTGISPLVKPSFENNPNSVDLNESNHLIYITFDEALFIKDIMQLEKFCRIWNKMLAAFTLLTREDINEIRIYDIESTSLTFYAGLKTINTLTKGTYQVLLGYKKVLEVRRLQLELDSLKLNFRDEIKHLLEEEIINIVDIISEKVTEELLNKFEWNDPSERSQIQKAVQVSLKQTLDFIEKGGKIVSKHSSDLGKLNDTIYAILNNIYDLESSNIKDHASVDLTVDFN